MPYNELIKNFEKIRSYMREFYVYGFRKRGELGSKSARSYDNERRRIESWFGDYMSFRRDSKGKRVFLSIDSRDVKGNPLYKAFKAKSFTDGDITFHFLLMDLLADGRALSAAQITDALGDEYLGKTGHETVIDESTVRKKLKEYVSIGLLEVKRSGRQAVYTLSNDTVDLPGWRDAIEFFSEEAPMGVVGSYLLDKVQDQQQVFAFKHNYFAQAIDSIQVEELVEAIEKHRITEVTVKPRRRESSSVLTVLPLKIYVSTQYGRHYMICWLYSEAKPISVRIDSISHVRLLDPDPAWEDYARRFEICQKGMWGVSLTGKMELKTVELIIRHEPEEQYIVERMKRESGPGTVEEPDEYTCRFTAELYDPMEMLPWIRTFIGRIVSFRCSDAAVEQRFYNDLDAMKRMYGGAADDLS